MNEIQEQNTIQKQNVLVRIEPQFLWHVLSEVSAVGKFTDNEIDSQIAILNTGIGRELIAPLNWIESHGLEAGRPNLVSALEEILCADGERGLEVGSVWPEVVNTVRGLGAVAATDRVIHRLKYVKAQLSKINFQNNLT